MQYWLQAQSNSKGKRPTTLTGEIQPPQVLQTQRFPRGKGMHPPCRCPVFPEAGHAIPQVQVAPFCQMSGSVFQGSPAVAGGIRTQPAARSLQPWAAEALISLSGTALRRLRQVSSRPQQKQVGKNTNLSSSSDCGSKPWARPSLTGQGECTSRYQYEFPRARLTRELQFGDVCLLCVHWGGFLPCRGRSNLCIGSTVALLSTHSTSTRETVINKAQLLCYPRILAVFYS